MGTTESIFADSDEHEDGNPSTIPPHSFHPTGERQFSGADGPIELPPHTHDRARRPMGHSRHGMSERPRPKHSPAPREKYFQLNGLIVGSSRTGKHILLQRLAGKEPQFSHHHPAASARRRRDDGESVSNDSNKQTVTTPYQAPSNLPTLDNAIELRVQASTKAVKRTRHDFYILLVDPRHDRTKVQKFLTKTLHTALRAQGYYVEEAVAATSSTAPVSADTAATLTPFCLCLLRNFCDLWPMNDSEAAADMISDSELTSWTLQVMETYAMDESLVLLQCTNVSMLNCYGLNVLHHFVYQAYIRRKQYDLQTQLHSVDNAMTLSRRCSPTVVSYPQYLGELEKLLQQTSIGGVAGNSVASLSDGRGAQRGAIDDDETATTATSSGAALSRRRIIASPLADDVPAKRPLGRASLGDSSSQSTLPSVQPSHENSRDVLEAFLESDSSNDDDDDEFNGSRQYEAAPVSGTKGPPLASVVTSTSSIPISNQTESMRNGQSRAKPISLRRVDSESHDSGDEFYMDDRPTDSTNGHDKNLATETDIHTMDPDGLDVVQDQDGNVNNPSSLKASMAPTLVETELAESNHETTLNDNGALERNERSDEREPLGLPRGTDETDVADSAESKQIEKDAAACVEQPESKNSFPSTAVAANELSDAARAAIATAQLDFTRMLEETERQLKKSKKKGKGDKKARKKVDTPTS
jgi:hypothetical protein